MGMPSMATHIRLYVWMPDLALEVSLDSPGVGRRAACLVLIIRLTAAEANICREHLSCTFTSDALYWSSSCVARGPVCGRLNAADRRTSGRANTMCRSIKTLFNLEPPATEAEIHAASLQFVRKLSGCNQPSRANEAAFAAAVDDIALISLRLLGSLASSAPPRNREEEAARARARSLQRFGA
jgi:hypothetical protein